MLHPSPQRKQGKTRTITRESGPDSLAGASGLYGKGDEHAAAGEPMFTNHITSCTRPSGAGDKRDTKGP
jgi:hypothetical protein